MTKKKEIRGNLSLAKAKIYAGKETYFSELELQGIQAFATLALAEEARTKNLLEYFQLLGPTEESGDIEIEIRKRLGLSE